MLRHLAVGRLTLLEKVSLSILLAFFKPSHQKPSRQVKLLVIASSHTRLASPEVVDRGLAESVLKLSIGVGAFKKDFFCLTKVCPLA